MCGSQQYSISAPATTIILTNTIQVKSSSKAQAGTQQVSLLVTLSSYQTITLQVPFTVNLIYLQPSPAISVVYTVEDPVLVSSNPCTVIPSSFNIVYTNTQTLPPFTTFGSNSYSTYSTDQSLANQTIVLTTMC
jgi:hypothetical protein